jgi:hypothetical protein
VQRLLNIANNNNSPDMTVEQVPSGQSSRAVTTKIYCSQEVEAARTK